MPRLVNHAQRREDVADAAWRVIDRVGMESTTLRDIAVELGTTTGSLAHYFRNKQELVAFAFRHGCAKAFDRMEAAAERASPGLDRLRIALEMMLPDYLETESGAAATLSFWGSASREPRLAAVHKENYVIWRSRIRRYLREAIDRGEAPNDIDLDLETSALITVVDGAMVGSVLEPEHFSKERVRRILDLALRRIVAPQADSAVRAAKRASVV